jgi:hypothetical protein
LDHDRNTTIAKAEICLCDRDLCNNDNPFPDVPTTTQAPGPGCSDDLLFSTSSYPAGRLVCYEGPEESMAGREETISPGTECMFLSQGHTDSGFILEFFCEAGHWVVTLSQQAG